MTWMSEPMYFFLVLGLAAVLIEVVLFQLSTFWLLFIGIGALVASLVMYLFPGIGWAGGTATFVLVTFAVTLALYRPLRRWQKAPSPIQGNDVRGQQVSVIEQIRSGQTGKVEWSGAEWSAELAEAEHGPLEVGDQAEIVEMTGITLIVK